MIVRVRKSGEKRGAALPSSAKLHSLAHKRVERWKWGDWVGILLPVSGSDTSYRDAIRGELASQQREGERKVTVTTPTNTFSLAAFLSIWFIFCPQITTACNDDQFWLGSRSHGILRCLSFRLALHKLFCCRSFLRRSYSPTNNNGASSRVARLVTTS